MKKVKMLVAAVIATTGFAFAQEQQIPDFKNTPMLIKADGSLSKLEKPTQEVKTKTKGFSYGASQVTFLNILGGSSPVKIDPNGAKFIVKLNDAETDPEGTIYFTKVIVAKDTRELELAQGAAAMASAFGGKGKSVQRDDIKPEFEKVVPAVWKFTPSTPLEPGTEYAVVMPGNVAFCFATTGTAAKKKK
ncbi:MAG: hypothetical protein KIS94_15585 [Chitinophagales bacterium]|nr:hypothetical protein [Chitinophagales bacterium]